MSDRCRTASVAEPGTLVVTGLLLLVGQAGAGAAGEAEEAREPAEGASVVPRAVAAVHPNTVRVGEPFRLGVAVRLAPGEEVVFPSVLPPSDAFELRGVPEVESRADGTRRAYYTLVAWRDGSRRPPALELSVEAPGTRRSVSVRPPSVTVRSVLPPETEEAALREERPYVERGGVPWAWLAALALLALLAWWRRPRPAPAGGPTPAGRALADLEALGAAWSAGRLAGGAFFDRLEHILRGYGAAVKGWPPGRPLRFCIEDGRLARALRASALVRFAGLRAGEAEPDEALASGALWVRRDAASRGESAGVEERPERAGAEEDP